MVVEELIELNKLNLFVVSSFVTVYVLKSHRYLCS